MVPACTKRVLKSYYWADKLGYLTWGESASWGLDINNEVACRNFISEWAELVERDRNHPSLVTWTPLNETWRRIYPLCAEPV